MSKSRVELLNTITIPQLLLFTQKNSAAIRALARHVPTLPPKLYLHSTQMNGHVNKKNHFNIEWVNIRRDEQDLQDGADHLYPVNPVNPVHKVK